uniref:Nuclear receptor domain-containing protein n=1 Tax=Panagrolaimus sp. JU765 TaxID=591449 RepID=A0AC34QA58_9BILA
MEEATVSHFGVEVCTGCRAFFRRSVSQQKTYRCLNSKLCGKNNRINTRRMCKYCRFARCLEAGMLKSKEHLYSQKLDNNNKNTLIELIEPKKQEIIITLPPSSISLPESVLDHFLHFRRKITYERLQKYYKQPKDDDEFVDCMHTVKLGLNETKMIVDLLSATPIFDDLPDNDKRILFGDYSAVWTVQEQVFATVRHGGHHINKMYHQDGTTVRLNEDVAFKHWKPILMSMKDNRPVVFEMVIRFLLSLATYTTLEVSKCMEKTGMNDDEIAAFTALMFLRSGSLFDIFQGREGGEGKTW